MRIGITYNLKEEEAEATEEFDTVETVNAIASVFEKIGHKVVKLGGDINIVERIREEKIDFVFNIAEGTVGRNRESHIPCLLGMLRVPYSGSDPLTLGLTLDKTMTKKIALQLGIPVPLYRIIKNFDDLLETKDNLCYPLITKPAWEGSSKGIYASSKVDNSKDLEENIAILLDKYPGQPLLVEEYIEGKEITVGIIGNDCPQVLGLLEIVNKLNPGEDFFYSLEVKRDWRRLVDYRHPPQIEGWLDEEIRHYAIKAFKEFRCRDIARIDFRISKENKIYMLEINPLPGLSPEYADLVILTKKLAIEYEDLILSIFQHALSRYSFKPKKEFIKVN